jgi:hypothetical protein
MPGLSAKFWRLVADLDSRRWVLAAALFVAVFLVGGLLALLLFRICQEVPENDEYHSGRHVGTDAPLARGIPHLATYSVFGVPDLTRRRSS